MTRLSALLVVTFAFTPALARAEPASPVEAPLAAAREVPARPVDARSPAAKTPCRADGKPPFVFALGGSTMQIVLGPMFERRLGKAGLRAGYRGRAASGLARYDYFDWPTAAHELLGEHDPDVFVVSLGSNDGQSLREVGGRWYPLNKPGWREEYARRVDAFLAQLAGKDKRRAILWFGPAAHRDDAKRARGAVVSEIIRERITRFEGRAWYLDLYARTSTADGGALEELRLPDGDEVVPLRKSDGFHLTQPGVEAMMFAPVDALLTPCKKVR